MQVLYARSNEQPLLYRRRSVPGRAPVDTVGCDAVRFVSPSSLAVNTGSRLLLQQH
jgi:hypothetical protein